MKVYIETHDIYFGLDEGVETISIDSFTNATDSCLEYILNNADVLIVLDENTLEAKHYLKVEDKFYSIEEDNDLLYNYYVYGIVGNL